MLPLVALAALVHHTTGMSGMVPSFAYQHYTPDTDLYHPLYHNHPMMYQPGGKPIQYRPQPLNAFHVQPPMAPRQKRLNYNKPRRHSTYYKPKTQQAQHTIYRDHKPAAKYNHKPVYGDHHHVVEEPYHHKVQPKQYKPKYVKPVHKPHKPKYKPHPAYKAPKTVYHPHEPAVYHKPKPVVEDFHAEASYHHNDHHDYNKAARPYAFDYGVKDEYTGTNFGHSQTSDGKKVEGSYSVALPDGRIQHVTYTADKANGFQAHVRYEGEAVYPQNYIKNHGVVLKHSNGYDPNHHNSQFNNNHY